MTPPTRLDFLDGTLNGIICEITAGNMPKNRNLIPFSQPGRFRFLIGGVMTPPYESAIQTTIYRLFRPISTMDIIHESLWEHKGQILIYQQFA